MQSKYLSLFCVLLILSNCTAQKQSEFQLGDTVLVYEEIQDQESAQDGLMVDFYARGYEMKFMDPMTHEPFSGTIVDDQSLYRGRYSLIDGYMKELITYYEDGSPSYFAIYDEGAIVKMSSWYRDGSLRSKLDGGEDWTYSYFDKKGYQTMLIEDNMQTEFYENGSIKSQIPFDSSKLYHGTATVYDEDGSKKAELEYQSGKLVSMSEASSQP